MMEDKDALFQEWEKLKIWDSLRLVLAQMPENCEQLWTFVRSDIFLNNSREEWVMSEKDVTLVKLKS